MSCILISFLIAFPVLHPGPSDVLETSSIYGWTVPELLGWETAFIRDGVPILGTDLPTFPGWGSFESITVRSPLEAGVWGNGNWEMDIASSTLPDSSFSSGIGLIQNTSSRHRYSAFLRRPVLSGILIDLSMAREDTLNNQRLAVQSGEFVAGGRGWQTTENGYALWVGWNPDNVITRLSFGHLHQGGRYWEAIGSWDTAISLCDVKTAGSVSISDDSLVSAEGHLRLEIPLRGIRTVIRTDINDDDGELSLGGTAGLIAESGIFNFQAGITVLQDSDPHFIGLAGIENLQVIVDADRNGFEGGMQSSLITEYGFLHAGTSIKEDSIKFDGIVLPSLPWGASGRIHGGVSWEYLHTDTTETGTMDVKSLFTLGRFAFIFALEDVLDDYRSYSFGITWTFSDMPPEIIEGDDRL